MALTTLHQDGCRDLPRALRRRLLSWKVSYGHLYVAKFRKKDFDENGYLVVDPLKPWIYAVLRELTLKEYLAFSELAAVDALLAATSLVELCLLGCCLEDETFITVEDDPAISDHLFGVLVSMSGFFDGKVIDAQLKARDVYGPPYRFASALVTKYGFEPERLKSYTDSELADISIYLQRTKREHASGQPPEVDRVRALVKASEEASATTLREAIAKHRSTANVERINPDAENVALKMHFGELLTSRPVPDVRKMKKFDPATMGPKFLHKKADR